MSMEDDDRTLFIGNIDKNVTEEILYELFLQAGPVERVSIPSKRNDSSRYGFITYKHKCSVNYALDLFKGTNLFKKELDIKKRCPKNNANWGGAVPDSMRQSPNKLDLQDQLHNLKLLAQNLNHIPQSLISFTLNSLQGNCSNRNRPYDFGMKNYFSRQREVRDRRKDRDYCNKLYPRQKIRHMD